RPAPGPGARRAPAAAAGPPHGPQSSGCIRRCGASSGLHRHCWCVRSSARLASCGGNSDVAGRASAAEKVDPRPFSTAGTSKLIPIPQADTNLRVAETRPLFASEQRAGLLGFPHALVERLAGGGGGFGLSAGVGIDLGEVERRLAVVGDRRGTLVHLYGARVVSIVVGLLAENHVVPGELRVLLDDALGEAFFDHRERLGVAI